MTTISDGVGLREIARELDLQSSTVTYWVKQGWVTVIDPVGGPGKKMLLDRASVLECFKARVKKDKRHRAKGRSRARTAAHPRHPAALHRH